MSSRSPVYGVGFMVYGYCALGVALDSCPVAVLFLVLGLWFMVYGLWLRIIAL